MNQINFKSNTSRNIIRIRKFKTRPIPLRDPEANLAKTYSTFSFKQEKTTKISPCKNLLNQPSAPLSLSDLLTPTQTPNLHSRPRIQAYPSSYLLSPFTPKSKII